MNMEAPRVVTVPLSSKRILVAVVAALALAGGLYEAPSLFDKLAGRTPSVGQVMLGGTFECRPGDTTIVAPDQQIYHPQRKIWGDWVVWSLDKPGPLNAAPSDIYAYHLTTGEIRPLAVDSNFKIAPMIYEDKVVWREVTYDGTPYRLVLYNLTTNQTRTIVSYHDANPYVSGIYENEAVVQVGTNNTTESGTFVYDLDTLQSTRIANDTDGPTPIWKNEVVWTTYDPTIAKSELVLHDLTSNTTSVLVTTDRGIGEASFHNDTIVFEEGSQPRGSRIPNVHAFGLSNGTEIRIAGNINDSASHASIGGDWILYLDIPNSQGTGRFMAYHLPTGKRFQVTNNDVNVWGDIWENRAVFLKWNLKVNPPRQNVALTCLPEAP